MPRKPKSIHPLRMLRYALGKWNQEQLAVALGVSASWINALESKGTPTPESMIETIQGRFGVRLRGVYPIDSESDNGLLFLYQTASIAAQSAAHSEVNEIKNNDAAEALRLFFEPKIRELFDVLCRNKKAVPALMALERWIAETSENFGPKVKSEFLKNPRNAARYFELDRIPMLSETASKAYTKQLSSGSFREKGGALPPPPHIRELVEKLEPEGQGIHRRGESFYALLLDLSVAVMAVYDTPLTPQSKPRYPAAKSPKKPRRSSPLQASGSARKASG